MTATSHSRGTWTILLDDEEPRTSKGPTRTQDSPLAPWQLLGICDPRHPLCVSADSIDWESLVARVAKTLPPRPKWPSRELRLVLGLVSLSKSHGLDEVEAISRFEESIYWQYFCGLREVQWKCTVTPVTLVRWKELFRELALDVDVEIARN